MDFSLNPRGVELAALKTNLTDPVTGEKYYEEQIGEGTISFFCKIFPFENGQPGTPPQRGDGAQVYTIYIRTEATSLERENAIVENKLFYIDRRGNNQELVFYTCTPKWSITPTFEDWKNSIATGTK
jgi:hypothetical protein